MRPSLPPWNSVNQRAPSGPVVIQCGSLPAVGMGNSVKARVFGLKRPTLLADASTNQRLPSGPAVMPSGPLFGVGMVYSARITPAVDILAIRLPLRWVYQRL